MPIFQLGAGSFPPLKTETPKSASDELGDRISRHVEEMVEKSLTGAFDKEAPVNVAKWSMIGMLNLVIFVAVVIAIIFLLKLAF